MNSSLLKMEMEKIEGKKFSFCFLRFFETKLSGILSNICVEFKFIRCYLLVSVNEMKILTEIREMMLSNML